MARTYTPFNTPVIDCCPICNKRFDIVDVSALRRTFREHLETVHPDYLGWTRRLRWIFPLSFFFATILAFTPMYLTSGNTPPSSPFYVAFLFPVIVIIYSMVRIRAIKKHWAEEHWDSANIRSES